ncbi:M50 family metallopeptidase [Gorillibacterium massiliense]|uniref:M50 family metallopeptidase n=1 Tax=Gorillibacterium massiliense TaxID=1280390 RepID=UPI0004BAB368|nr:M50 family metallopeptidase [Gorillibacterium massiliense]
MIKVFGTAYRFHPLFILLMLVSIAAGYFIELLTLFAIVLIHELGHVAAARSFGWRVKEVQLLPFGGVAVTEESNGMPAKEEILIALAGPLQNAVMIAIGLIMKVAIGQNAEWWDYFIKANLLVGGFNLLPVLPLDGGRVTLALLSYSISFHKALLVGTRISFALSLLLAVAAVIPLYSTGIHLNLLAVALFLAASNWFSMKHVSFQFLRFLAGRERRAALFLLKGGAAQPLLVTGRRTMGDIAQMFMREKYHLIYICGEQGSIRRVVTEQSFLRLFFAGEQSNRAISDVFMIK